jgi:hypothetical protein
MTGAMKPHPRRVEKSLMPARPENDMLGGRRNKISMKTAIIIGNETDADVDAITEVAMAAFETLEISNHTEQFIIEALRAARALTVSLVAELDDRIIGHIAFSPVTVSDGTQMANKELKAMRQTAHLSSAIRLPLKSTLSVL